MSYPDSDRYKKSIKFPLVLKFVQSSNETSTLKQICLGYRIQMCETMARKKKKKNTRCWWEKIMLKLFGQVQLFVLGIHKVLF